MKAVAVLPSRHEVRLIDTQAPALAGPSSVKLRMLEVGICGTDREIADCQYGTPPGGEEHLVIGHESLGEVVEVGPNVNGLKPGDLAIPMVRRPCPHAECLPCREGRQDFCTTGDFVERGIKEAHGFMTEYVVDDARYMLRVPKKLREVAVLVEPLTIAEKALAQLALVQQRLPWTCPIERGVRTAERHTCHRAVVLGAGPVGLLGTMALIHAGFRTTVYSRDRKPNERADLVEALGGTYVSSQDVSPRELAERMGSIDVVYEAVGASQVAFDVLEVLGTNGMFVFTGVPARKGPIQVDTDLLMRNLVLKNQVVLGSVNAGRGDFERAIEDLGAFLERWPAAVRSMITGRHPLSDAKGLLESRSGIKNVLAMTE